MQPVIILTQDPYRLTVDEYLETWGAPLRGMLSVHTYASTLFRYRGRRALLGRLGGTGLGRVLPRSARRALKDRVAPPADLGGRHRRATWVFADLERLTPQESEAAAQLWALLERDGRAIALLNHPTRAMRRFELLRALSDRRVNDYDVWRVTERRMPTRWPVFLRNEDDHGGSRSPLLASVAALEAALADLDARGESRENKLIVEYRSTADASGVFRKYAAFRVGDRIVPRHLFFGYDWMLKHATLRAPAYLREEEAYLETNPHAEELRALFALARVEYGRIDYGFANGRIQVWEINTNPAILAPRHAEDPARRPVHDRFAQAFADALAALGGAGR